MNFRNQHPNRAHSQSSFEYATPRIRITPNDLTGTALELPKVMHFISSPNRAWDVMSEVREGWTPIIVYEPVPVRDSCT